MRYQALSPRWLLPLVVLLMLMASEVASVRLVGHPFAGFRFEPTLTVSGASLPQWPGTVAGLAQEDHILRANGRAVSGPDDLWAIARRETVGSVIHYLVEREGQVREIGVATARYSWRDWAQECLPDQLLAIGFWLIGIVGFYVKPGNAAARANLYFTAAMATILGIGADYDTTRHFAAIYVTALMLLGATCIHLAACFPEPVPWFQGRPWLVRLAYVPALSIGAVALALYRPAIQSAGLAQEVYLTLNWVVMYAWNLLAILILFGALLWRSIRPASRLEGPQARLALFGAVAGFLPTVLLYVIPTLLKADAETLTVLGGTIRNFVICFPLSIAYAIVRTKLFDIDVVIKRTLQYAVVITVLGGLYLGVMAGAGYALQLWIPKGSSQVTNALAAAAMAFAFTPLSRRTQAFIDRLFSRKDYDPTRILEGFGSAIHGSTDPEELFQAFVTALDSSVKPAFIQLDVPALGVWTKGAGPTEISHPLKSGGMGIGFARVGTRKSDLPYSAADQAMYASLASQLGMAVENVLLISRIRSQERVSREIEIAHDVQAGLLPKKLPEFPGVELAAHNEAALEMGGDFYEVLELPNGLVGLVVGDVSGKGVPSAILGAVCLTLFRAIAPLYASPAEGLQAINDALIRYQASKKMFVAVTYVIYDPATGQAIGINAGNPAPLLDGVEIDAKGMPLGASRRACYTPFEVAVEPGGTLVLMSDGAVDARNPDGERFGDQGVARLVSEVQAEGPGHLVEELKKAISGFRAERALYDDLTVVALRRLSSALDGEPVPGLASTRA